MPSLPRPPRSQRLVFPYRLVLQYDDRNTKVLDPVFFPVPLEVDPTSDFSLEPLVDGWAVEFSPENPTLRWFVERIEDEREECITESMLLRDPNFRQGTAYCRRFND
jgi:hypothetical protein